MLRNGPYNISFSIAMFFTILMLCLIDPAKSARPANCPGGSLTNAQRDLLVKFHNQYRSLVATGNAVSRTGSLPAGKNIYELEYDCQLETEAGAAAENGCGQVTTITNQINSKSQTSNAIISLGPDKILEDAVDSFYEPGILVGITDPTNKITAATQHSFVNMVSSKNTKVGCSYRSCVTPYKHVIVTCKYNTQIPLQEVIYEKGAPCRQDADCPQAIRSYCNVATSLCTITEPILTTTIVTTSSSTASSTPSTRGMCANAQMTDNVRNRIVALHNDRRMYLAQGNVRNGRNPYNCPKAADMFQMVYDCNLETSAITYANTCSLTGSPASSRPGQGENFFVGPLTSNKMTAAETAVESWWSQISRNGLNKKMTYLNSLATKPNAPLAFTQMAWAHSTRIGCGVVDCPGNTFTVCRYAPAGNILNQQIYQVGEPCSKCYPCLGNGLCQAP